MQDMQTEEGESKHHISDTVVVLTDNIEVTDRVFSATRLTQNVDNATNTVFHVILHLQASAPRQI